MLYFMKLKKGIFIISIVVLSVFSGVFYLTGRKTEVALVNFPQFQIARMVKSTDGSKIRFGIYGAEDIRRIKKSDAALIFGMGLRIGDEERNFLHSLDAEKTPFVVIGATDPRNNISNLDSLRARTLVDYASNGGTINYRSLFNYIRKELKGKDAGDIAPLIRIADDAFFHMGGERAYESLAEYESYYKGSGFYKENAPKIALVANMIANPFTSDKDYLDSLIMNLEKRGFNLYPIYGIGRRLELLKEVSPDAVVYLAHGRLAMGYADAAAEWLEKENIPLFAPLTINNTHEAWLADKRGMSGGFLSQTVTMPESDGAVLPMALIAQFEENGIYEFKPIPGKLADFTQTVANYMKLRGMPNKDKRLAIYYYKGAGTGPLVAWGTEVIPSLYNILKRLKKEGYTVKNLPDNLKDFEIYVMKSGPLFGSYAEGSIRNYMESDYPALVDAEDYDRWLKEKLMPSVYEELIRIHGYPPGNYMCAEKGGRAYIGVPKVDFGNIVLLPQPIQGTGSNSFAAVHGANPMPPHSYIASYLWVQNDFKADVLLHFGTHGSLEFIPGKQIGLSAYDWTDRLTTPLPHIYPYSLGDVGEAMIAKRRSYGVTVSHLTPPFIPSDLRKTTDRLLEKLGDYLSAEKEDAALSAEIREIVLKSGFDKDLRLDSVSGRPYSRSEAEEIQNFAEEVVTSKITGGLYTWGLPYAEDKIRSSVELMSADAIAYSLARIDLLKGRITEKEMGNQAFFSSAYKKPAAALIKSYLRAGKTDPYPLLRKWGITENDLRRADSIRTISSPDMNRMLGDMLKALPAGKKVRKHPSWIPKIGRRPETSETAAAPVLETERKSSPEERDFADAVSDLREAALNLTYYGERLRISPEAELKALLNALNGGYVAPTSGGDYAANPRTLPSGRNIYSVNAEATPSLKAWDNGVKLAEDMIAAYKESHGGKMPVKVSFSLWSGSFVESEGTTVAEILYLLGVEPVRDMFNRVLDVRLIPMERLGRPRIDVLVQTSGQFRDLAASRLALIHKAVMLAAKAGDGGENYVAKGVADAEKVLLGKGLAPEDARELSVTRVFGGLNGMYGTGINSMVESGDRWEKEKEIAEVYLNNMGAFYGNADRWGDFRTGVFEAAMQNTEVVVQPRQSNNWGALSLDHVYEFMGGMSLAVRNVTGKDPEGYFNDLRNRSHSRVQKLNTAIGVEARTTLLNPAYIRELVKGGASSASVFAETVRNTYGWNVMKPDAIHGEMWNDIYKVYIEDDFRLGLRRFFERESPAAIQEITAVMMETARKGYWKASETQLRTIARLHAEVVKTHGAACNGFTCDNAKLADFMQKHMDSGEVSEYRKKLDEVRKPDNVEGKKDNVVLKKEEKNALKKVSHPFYSSKIALGVFAVFVALVLMLYYMRKNGKNG